MFLIKRAFVGKKDLYLSKCTVKQQLNLMRLYEVLKMTFHYDATSITQNFEWYICVSKVAKIRFRILKVLVTHHQAEVKKIWKI